MEMKIEGCVPAVLREVINIFKSVYDDTSPEDNSFVYDVPADIIREAGIRNLLKAFGWLTKHKIVNNVKCFRASLMIIGDVGVKRRNLGCEQEHWLTLKEVHEVFGDFLEQTIGNLKKIKGKLTISREELLKSIKLCEEAAGRQGRTSQPLLHTDGHQVQPEDPKLDEEEQTRTHPTCAVEKNIGYIQFSERGKRIKIGGTNTRSFKLIQCLFAPFGVAKNIDTTFDAIRLAKDAEDEVLSDPYRGKQKKITIIKNTIKDVQKALSKAGFPGKLKLTVDKEKAWAQLL